MIDLIDANIYEKIEQIFEEENLKVNGKEIIEFLESKARDLDEKGTYFIEDTFYLGKKQINVVYQFKVEILGNYKEIILEEILF